MNSVIQTFSKWIEPQEMPLESWPKTWKAFSDFGSGSFFTAPLWMSRVLKLEQNPVEFITQSQAGVPIAHALLFRGKGRKISPLSRNLALLNCPQSGLDARLTTVWNMPAAEMRCQGAAFHALIDHVSKGKDWDALFLPGVPQDLATSRPDLLLINDSPDYVIDIPDPEDDFTLEDFSARLRSGSKRVLRQAEAYYSRLGPLRVEFSKDLEQSLEWFAKLEVLHQERWSDPERPGSFVAPGFRAFHEDLIRTSAHLNNPNCHTDLIRISAGDHCLGLVYGFSWHDEFLYYNSGFDYSMQDSHARPGILSHALIATQLAGRGYKRYNLLGGDAPYKQQLATPVSGCGNYLWRRRGLGTSIEGLARKVKRFWT